MSLMSKVIKIMLLDDHDVVLYGLRASISLKKNLEIIGLFNDSQSLLNALRQQVPDILIMDYSLRPSDFDGVNLIRFVATRYPQCQIFILSANTNASIMKIAKQAGAKYFFSKEKNTDEIMRIIYNMVSNPVVQSKESLEQINDDKLDEDLLVNLSPKEKEVIRCCLEGMTVTDISVKFSRSVKTISTQKKSAFDKLGVANDSALHKLWNQVKKK